MLKSATRKISVYLNVDENSIRDYFNLHYPARLERRQLGQEFQNYLNDSVACAGRHTVIDYKVFCSESGSMRFMAERLMKTIRRHFQIKKMLKEVEFQKFKNFLAALNNVTIDGAATRVLTTQYETIRIQSNGTSWFIL